MSHTTLQQIEAIATDPHAVRCLCLRGRGSVVVRRASHVGVRNNRAFDRSLLLMHLDLECPQCGLPLVDHAPELG
jgi:hypothetical protein